MAIELQEFAKTVLFGRTLEEKLSFPREEIVDTCRGSGLIGAPKLERPDHLVLREEGVRAEHPSKSKLIDEKERGRLLHFFCNHELLATELMALALLKFPDAPASFRLGLLETLKDEQIHTRIYMHRMKQCGVEFGELPLSDYFWKSVSSMEDPLDYVTRLSLTFEQANLDYAREYKAAFEDAGDHATAGILDRIYRDEIDHVGFGLKWFRRWKAAGKTDWEAYRERLSFPLSPSRAKGNVFNASGRSAVGFDKSFINELQVFSQSRGRTPRVLWFNPDAESFAASNACEESAWQRSALQSDLEILPAFFGRRDDLLVVAQRPSREHLLRLRSFGIQMPEIVEENMSSSFPTAPEIARKIDSICPWAWTPDSLAYFGKTLARVTRPVDVARLWSARRRELFSKEWSARWGERLAADVPIDGWTAPAEVYGQAVRNDDELDVARRRLAALGYRDVVCKAPFGTAANGNRCIMDAEGMTEPVRSWLARIWREQGLVVVEPWLERVFDFSVQYEMRNDGLDTVAYTRLFNNRRGQFRGILTGPFARGLGRELARFLMEPNGGKPRLYDWYENTVGPKLHVDLEEAGFSGPLGVDAFVYRDPAGALQLKTMVELNPRMTMGRIAHELGAHCGARSVGFFELVAQAQMRKRGFSDFGAYAEWLAVAWPVALTEESKPRIASGSFALNDPASAKRYLAVFHVRHQMSDLPV